MLENNIRPASNNGRVRDLAARNCDSRLGVTRSVTVTAAVGLDAKPLVPITKILRSLVYEKNALLNSAFRCDCMNWSQSVEVVPMLPVLARSIAILDSGLQDIVHIATVTVAHATRNSSRWLLACGKSKHYHGSSSRQAQSFEGSNCNTLFIPTRTQGP